MENWNTGNNYAPSQVNNGSKWETTPSVEDLVKIAETVFNINAQKTREGLLPHCAQSESNSHENCTESGWMYITADPNGPGGASVDYICLTMAYSDSILVQLAFEIDKKAIWLTRKYRNVEGEYVWDEWADLSGELPAAQAGSVVTYDSKKVDLHLQFDSANGILNINTILR